MNCESPDPQMIRMYYVGIPVILSPQVNAFRAQHDPKYGVNEAHATLVAPFPASSMTDELSTHFANVAAAYYTQEMYAEGYHITPQGYIFYTFDTQSAQLLSDIYQRLHDYPFLASRHENHPFLPHITIGKCISGQHIPQEVIVEIETICTRYPIKFDRVRLYGILEEPKKRTVMHDYALSEP